LNSLIFNHHHEKTAFANPCRSPAVGQTEFAPTVMNSSILGIFAAISIKAVPKSYRSHIEIAKKIFDKMFDIGLGHRYTRQQ